MHLSTVDNRDAWHSLIRTLPQSHVLQTWDWGEFKRKTTGWQPQRYAFELDGQIVAAASVLQRPIGPFSFVYVPKGPLFRSLELTIVDAVLDALIKQYPRAIWIKIDPDVIIATGLLTEQGNSTEQPYIPQEEGLAFQARLQQKNWRFSSDQVQFRNTLILDLTLEEADLLAQMSQSTRRKIRQADKHAIHVREGTKADLRVLYELYVTTGQRQDFIVRPWEYYHLLWTSFLDAQLAQVFVAEHEGQILSGCVLFCFADRVWYFYGMSSNEHRHMQPNYALQWAAIRWAKANGYRVYDWWGAPNSFVEADPMWGVYRFKRGFGSTVVHTVGAWDYAPHAGVYWLYTRAVPRLRSLLRRAKSKGK